MSDQWRLSAIQNVAIVKISFSCDQCLLQQTTKITPMYLLHTHSTKKIKIQYNIKWKYHCPKILVWFFYLRWYKFQLSLKAIVDLCSRVEFSSAESKTLWMGGGVEKLYENNSILRSSSILYNSILKESSCIERLHLTQRQSEIRFSNSIARYMNSCLPNSINLKSSYLWI